jgi:hypothetical protein
MKAYSPSPEELEIIRSVFDYDPETGVVSRVRGYTDKLGRFKTRGAGKPAGVLDREKGYLGFKICGSKMQCHRLAWFLHYRAWPSGQIDHINGDGADNRIANLRIVTNAENQWNRHRKAGISQDLPVGIYRTTKNGIPVFRAHCERNGKRRACSFRKLEHAIKARERYRRELFGEEWAEIPT